MGGAEQLEPRFSREDLDRVIRRAAELQFEDGGGSDLVAEDEILRIGGEVGIEGRHLRRALGELRAESLRPGMPADEGVMARLMGSGLARVSRVVPGAPEEVERRLEEHLQAGESLTRVRKRAGRSLWEPAGGVVAELQRAFRWRGFRYELAKVGSLELIVSPVEEGFSLVTITADLRRSRGEAGAGWIGGSTFGAAALGGAAGFAVGAPLIAIPAAAIGTLAGVRRARRQVTRSVDRARLTMEGILDRLEAGEPLARLRPGNWKDQLGL